MRLGIPCLTKSLVLFVACFTTKLTLAASVIALDRAGYALSYDCTNRTAIRYDYTLQKDNGTAARPADYFWILAYRRAVKLSLRLLPTAEWKRDGIVGIS